MQTGGHDTFSDKSKSKRRKGKERAESPGTYSLKEDGTVVPLDECSHPQMVYTLTLNNEIPNRIEMFFAITTSIKENYKDGDVMSLRFGGMRKGLPGGFFDSGMMMDIYYEQKKRHVNIFRTGSLGICDMNSKGICKEIGRLVCDLLNKTNKYLKEVSSLKGLRRAMRWLVSVSKGEEFQILNTMKLKDDKEFGNMTFGNWVTENRILWPTEIPEEHKQIIEKVAPMFDDLINEEGIPYIALVERANMIKSIARKKDYIENYEVSTVKLSALTYRYNLGFQIDRYMLSSLLHEMGYKVHFANDVSAVVEVTINGNEVIDKNKVKKKDMTSRQILAFSPGGGISHSGPTREIVRKTYMKIMTDLSSIRNEIKLNSR